MNKMTAVVLLAAALAALSIQFDAQAQEQTIYKWVDAEGVVHYTARPPEGIDYEEVGIEMRESADSAAGGGETGGDNGAAEETPPELPEMAQSEPEDEAMAERCAQARSNIEDLNRYENITVEGEDGEQRPVPEEERMRMIEEAQRFIDEWC